MLWYQTTVDKIHGNSPPSSLSEGVIIFEGDFSFELDGFLVEKLVAKNR